VVIARGALEHGDQIWYYPAVTIYAIAWIHEISERASGTKIANDTVCIFVVWENEMMSIHPGVPRQYTPRRRFLKMYLEAIIELV